MNHNEIKNALPSYHDGELTVDEAERVERHVGSCLECREELAELEHLSAMLAPPAEPARVDLFVQRVLARLPEPTPSVWQQISAWWRVPVLAMSALLLVSVGSQLTDSAPSSRALLCGDTSSSTVKHLCSDNSISSDELMNLIWGDL